MADKIKLATIETGGTWGRLGNWLAAGLKPAGFEVELLKRGSEIPESAYRVDSGEADLSVSTTFGAREAHFGRPPYEKKLAIKGIAEIQYPNHWFVNMIRADTGLSSFDDLVKEHPPLRLCLPSPNMLVSYPVKAIFRLFGLDPYIDIPKWGGEIITNFSNVPELLATGRADGLFRENSPTRYDVSQRAGMKFLQLTEQQVRQVADEMGMKASHIEAETYKHQHERIRTLDAEGFTVFTRSDLPAEMGYRIAMAIDHYTLSHYISSSTFYSPRFAVHTGAPLLEGAARYYRERGYLLES